VKQTPCGWFELLCYLFRRQHMAFFNSKAGGAICHAFFSMNWPICFASAKLRLKSCNLCANYSIHKISVTHSIRKAYARKNDRSVLPVIFPLSLSKNMTNCTIFGNVIDLCL
jgi:hypothetical protein